MGDMTKEAYRWCLSNEFHEVEIESSKPGKFYTVRFSHGQWSCNCPDHVYRNSHCKHIQAADDSRCCYGWGAAAGSPAHFDDKTCPACGGPTSVVEVMV